MIFFTIDKAETGTVFRWVCMNFLDTPDEPSAGNSDLFVKIAAFHDTIIATNVQDRIGKLIIHKKVDFPQKLIEMHDIGNFMDSVRRYIEKHQNLQVTNQQLQILDLYEQQKDINIVAFPGCGKRTIVELCHNVLPSSKSKFCESGETCILDNSFIINSQTALFVNKFLSASVKSPRAGLRPLLLIGPNIDIYMEWIKKALNGKNYAINSVLPVEFNIVTSLNLNAILATSTLVIIIMESFNADDALKYCKVYSSPSCSMSFCSSCSSTSKSISSNSLSSTTSSVSV
jgi:hypothetical protein